MSRRRRAQRALVGAGSLTAALAIFPVAAPAQGVTITGPEQFTENRGPNEAGILAAYQIVVSAMVAPSEHPTLVFAEQNGIRQSLWRYPLSLAPDMFVFLQRAGPRPAGPWQIFAERQDARGASVWTPGLARPQEVPLVQNLRVSGKGREPRVGWALPALAGFDIDRIRVGVRGGKRLYERFLDLVYLSGDLPASATSFTIPPGVLLAGERYIFQVMLEDLEGAALENRSVTFSEPYTPSP